MAGDSQAWTESTARVAGTDITLIKGGTGRPLLVLHEELGYPGWLRWQSVMAQVRTLYVPLHPGFGRSPRVEWISSVRDAAGFYSRLLRDMGLSPVDVIGFSLGGWIAAEMAANWPQQFRRMVLVAPMGMRPPEDEIKDMFTVTARAYLDASVHSRESTPEFATLFGGESTPEQFEAWEDARAEAARLAWKPYMYNPSLGPLLEGVQGLPTLLVWGKEDRIVPRSAGQVYNRSIVGSELALFDGCGHRPEIERCQEFVSLVQSFLA